jgi:hypothetical protein
MALSNYERVGKTLDPAVEDLAQVDCGPLGQDQKQDFVDFRENGYRRGEERLAFPQS